METCYALSNNELQSEPWRASRLICGSDGDWIKDDFEASYGGDAQRQL